MEKHFTGVGLFTVQDAEFTRTIHHPGWVPTRVGLSGRERQWLLISPFGIPGIGAEVGLRIADPCVPYRLDSEMGVWERDVERSAIS